VSEPSLGRIPATPPAQAPPKAAELDGHVEPAAATIDLSNPSLFTNRELSWLDFNDRVLQLAEGDL
jgi:polyphosphate kinase